MISRKLLSGVLAAAILCSSFMTSFAQDTVTSGGSQTSTTVSVEGEEKTAISSTDAAALKSLETLVPLRFICESQGATVGWDAKTWSSKIVKEDKSLEVTIGSKQAKVNGKTETLNSAVTTKDGRMLVPIALINKALGIKLTPETCSEILGTKFVELLQTGTYSDCKAMANDSFNALGDTALKQLAMGYASMGALTKNTVSTKSNAVHINSAIGYSLANGQPIEIIVRFDYNLKVDDIYLKALDGAPAYVTPSYDNKSGYTERQVVFGEKGWEIPGTLTIPNGKGPFPVVVLVHGSGPNDQDESLGSLKAFKDLAVGLASQNIAVLRYEKRTYEHNLKIAFQPNLTVMEETVNDALYAADFVSKLPEIDAKQVFVLGHSQGALLLPRIMANDKHDVIKGGIIASANSNFLGDVMLDQYAYLMKLGLATQQQYDSIKAQIDMIKSDEFTAQKQPQGYAMGDVAWWADLKSYNPVATAKTITKPLLVMQGKRDYQVTADKEYKGWQDGLAGMTNVSFKLYDRLNHMYTEGEGELSTPMEYYSPANIPEYVIKDIAQWIAR